MTVNVEITKNTKTNSLKVSALVQTSSKTGVEMEALTAVTVSCLTIYDMCKYLNKAIKIKNIKLVSKKAENREIFIFSIIKKGCFFQKRTYIEHYAY